MHKWILNQPGTLFRHRLSIPPLSLAMLDDAFPSTRVPRWPTFRCFLVNGGLAIKKALTISVVWHFYCPIISEKTLLAARADQVCVQFSCAAQTELVNLLKAKSQSIFICVKRLAVKRAKKGWRKQTHSIDWYQSLTAAWQLSVCLIAVLGGKAVTPQARKYCNRIKAEWLGEAKIQTCASAASDCRLWRWWQF